MKPVLLGVTGEEEACPVMIPGVEEACPVRGLRGGLLGVLGVEEAKGSQWKPAFIGWRRKACRVRGPCGGGRPVVVGVPEVVPGRKACPVRVEEACLDRGLWGGRLDVTSWYHGSYLPQRWLLLARPVPFGVPGVVESCPVWAEEACPVRGPRGGGLDITSSGQDPQFSKRGCYEPHP